MKKPNETKSLLNQALGLNSQERTVLLEQIDDTDLKRQVETLLADEAQQAAFFQQHGATTPHSQAIEPGSLINRIRIIKLLGQGGMGSVYLGFDEKLERQVAVKSIRPEHLKNQATQQRFVREAQIMSKINHPSICQLYDYLETADGDFLVLEYIKGQPLYQVALTDQQKLEALADLAAALAVAHEHGIVHRDLKPDNIMITDQGQLKVLDFGIAQSLSKPQISTTGETKTTNPSLTQQGSLVGTIRYMSPEQAQGKTIQTASDLYALGIIAQEVFSHQPAYQVMETDQLLTDVQNGKRAEAHGLPEPARQLIKDLTQLDPADRPTALAAEDRFKALLNAPKLKQKKIIKFCIITAGLLLLLVVAWQWQQFEQQQTSTKKINNYETQINDLVKQAEQIYVLPMHPVDEEISLIMAQGELLYGEIEFDDQLTEVDKRRLQGIIVLKGELYEEAIPLLMAGQAENHLLAYAWINLYIEKASAYADQHGFEQTMNDTEFKNTYLNPTLKYIELAHADAGQVIPLFQAFKLSQTESLEAGLAAINQLLDDEHWNKEAVNLKALILSASMSFAREKGDWDEANAYALMSIESYQLSAQMARSYPSTYSSLCLTHLGLMADGIQRSGERVMDFTQQGIVACKNALKIQPSNQFPMKLLARIYMMKAQWETNQGINANDSLAQAKHWNQQSSSLEDLFINSWTQGLILAFEAKQHMLYGERAQPVIDASLQVFNNMLKIDTEYRPYVVSDLLFVLTLQAQELIRQDQDPTAVFQRAQFLYDEVLLTPDLMVSEQWGLINNMAQVYLLELKAQFDHGQNILPLGKKLIAFLSPTENMLKNDPNQLLNLADTHLLVADYLRQQQQGIAEHLSLAADYIDQALAINPTSYSILLSQASLMTLQSYFSDQDYSQANEVFAQAIALNPNNPYSQHSWAKSLFIQAQNNPSATQQIASIKLANEIINLALAVDEFNHTFINTRVEIQELAGSLGVKLN